MPTRRDERTVAAGLTVNNILDGSLFEIVARNGTLLVAANSDNAAGEGLMSILADTETLMEESPVPLQSGAGLGPRLNEDVLLTERVARGDKVTIRIRNTGAGNIVFRTLISVP